MTETLINIYENILKYNNNEIIIIIDDKMNPWFAAKTIAIILAYVNPSKAIRDHVDKDDKTTLENLAQYLKKIPLNAQTHATYMNESGLFSLLMFSKTEESYKFKTWVTREVLPSIRKYGIYVIDNKYKTKIKKLNLEIKELKEQNEVLLNNQKKNKFPDGGLVYAVQPIRGNKNLIRIGKTKNMKKRKPSYDTTTPDRFKVLYEMEVDNPDQVELCIKSKLYPSRYMDNKDYYDCSLEKIKEIFKECKEFLMGGAKCQKCGIQFGDFTHLIDHSDKKHGISMNDKLVLQLSNKPSKMYGGGNILESENEYFYLYKYIKYKYKYNLLLKSPDERKRLLGILVD